MPIRTEPAPSARSIHTMLRAELDRLEALGKETSIRTDPDLKRRLDLALKAAFCPVCAEAQADGVPCASPGKACDQCARALDSLRTFRADIEAEAARRGADLRAKLAAWERDLP